MKYLQSFEEDKYRKIFKVTVIIVCLIVAFVFLIMVGQMQVESF